MTKLSELKKETLLNTEQYYQVSEAIKAGKPVDFYYSQKSSKSPLYWSGPGAGPEASKRITVQPYALGISNKYTESGVFMLAMIRKGETFSMSNTGIWRNYYLHRMGDVQQSSESWVTPSKRPTDDKLFKNIGQITMVHKELKNIPQDDTLDTDMDYDISEAEEADIKDLQKDVDEFSKNKEKIKTKLSDIAKQLLGDKNSK